MEIPFLLRWIACKMVFWYYIHVIITILTRIDWPLVIGNVYSTSNGRSHKRLCDVVRTLGLDILITFTECIFGRHVDVSWTFNERSADVDWSTFWTLEGRKLNVRPDVHPTLYARMCAQWKVVRELPSDLSGLDKFCHVSNFYNFYQIYKQYEPEFTFDILGK